MPINYWHNWSRNILRKSLKVSWEVMAWIAKLTRKNKFIWTTTIPLVVRRANLCDDPTEGTSSNHFGNTQNKRLLQNNLSPLTCNHTKPHADMHIAFFFVVFLSVVAFHFATSGTQKLNANVFSSNQVAKRRILTLRLAICCYCSIVSVPSNNTYGQDMTKLCDNAI